MKDLLGPKLARKIVCIIYCAICTVICVYLMFIFGGNVIANLIFA